MRRVPYVSGRVTPPKDLTPAIDALGDRGKAYLRALAAPHGGVVTPQMIAKAADYDRGELKSPI